MISGSRAAFKKIETIIFDADGVITTENEYWLAAELAILELFYSPQWVGLRDDTYQTALHKPGRPVLVGRFVNRDITERLKARGVVSNWDMTYFCCALFMLEVLGGIDPADRPKTIAGNGFTVENIKALGRAVTKRDLYLPKIEDIARDFFSVADRLRSAPGNGKPHRGNALGGVTDGASCGFSSLVAALNERAKAKYGIEAPVFFADGPLWRVCRTLFQEWYLGDDLFEAGNEEKLSTLAKDGLIQCESPIIPVGRLIDVFSMLKEGNLTLGIGTGRPHIEIVTPLANWGLLNFFSRTRISTNREISEAERHVEKTGLKTSLAKPHPYVFLKALFPDRSPAEILDMPLPVPDGEKVLVVGDTVADIAAAKAMGAQSAAVLSSVKNLERAESIKALEPDYILTDITAIKNLF